MIKKLKSFTDTLQKQNKSYPVEYSLMEFNSMYTVDFNSKSLGMTLYVADSLEDAETYYNAISCKFKDNPFHHEEISLQRVLKYDLKCDIINYEQIWKNYCTKELAERQDCIKQLEAIEPNKTTLDCIEDFKNCISVYKAYFLLLERNGKRNRGENII